jgi:hypothetical protein
MIEPRRELDLAKKPVGPEGGAQLRMKHLERHTSVVPQVVREVNGSHPATTELAVEPVS